MNEKNLHELIDRYESNYAFLNNSENDEIFKWKAVKCFRDVWFSENACKEDFSELFAKARKESSVLIDNSQVSPTNGIVKMAELCPEEVESLFRDVLFASDGGDINLRQINMEKFLTEIEKIRQKHFPQCWKYKQDRHAASCYLVFNAPEDNFIYRYSESEEFAKYIEFGMDIGSGEDFSLERYYQMCEVIVDALKQHKSLLDKHFELVKSGPFYRDESLHLLVFDLMYCCRAYNLYSGLVHLSKKESIKAFRLEQLREQEQAEKQKKIDELESQIHELEVSLEPYESISLMNVEVFQAKYGNGIIVAHNHDKIKVRFENEEKSFVINRKFSMRPTFENDKDIVDAYTEYSDIVMKIQRFRRELVELQ